MNAQQAIARELDHDRPGFDTETDLRHARNIIAGLAREGFVIMRESEWHRWRNDLGRANRLLREHGIDPEAGLP